MLYLPSSLVPSRQSPGIANSPTLEMQRWQDPRHSKRAHLAGRIEWAQGLIRSWQAMVAELHRLVARRVAVAVVHLS
jgi:hypothetical protein